MLSAMGRISSGREPGTRFHPAVPAGKGSCAQAWSREMPRSLGARAASLKTGAAAVGAGALLQELLHPLHALFVLHLGEGVLHRVDGVKIGEVQLARLAGASCCGTGCAFSPPGRGRRCPFPAPSAPGRARRCARPSPGRRPPSATTSGSSTEPPRPRRWSGTRRAPAWIQVHPSHNAGAPAGAAGSLAVEGQLLRRPARKMLRRTPGR